AGRSVVATRESPGTAGLTAAACPIDFHRGPLRCRPRESASNHRANRAKIRTNVPLVGCGTSSAGTTVRQYINQVLAILRASRTPSRAAYPGRGWCRAETGHDRRLSMINVSETAASKINELLAEENKEGSGLRVFVQGGGCSGFQYGLMIEENGQ